jgi:four helix bundle protein
MNFNEWCESVPVDIREDSLWKMEAYRLALFASELGWTDVTKLFADGRTTGLASQLYRALGSIHANLAEGYSRGTGRDRARFYEYALGSARESRDWYYDARHILGEVVCSHRMRLLTQIIRLLLVMVPDQRETVLREELPRYGTEITDEELGCLLNNAPVS